MATHKFTDRLTLTFSLGGGEDHEIEVDVKYSYSPGSPEHWDKGIGTWLPADAAEIELTEMHIADRQHHGHLVPLWAFHALYDDTELKCALEERALDELNRGPDD